MFLHLPVNLLSFVCMGDVAVALRVCECVPPPAFSWLKLQDSIKAVQGLQVVLANLNSALSKRTRFRK